MKPEAQFEKNLEIVAPLYGCEYVKIPDTRMINKNNRKTHREQKRPFDGVICTPEWNWCVECKIKSAKLENHQKKWREKINNINGKFLVLRRYENTKGIYYKIESHFGTWKTTELKDIFEFCKLKHYKGE